MIKSHLLSVSSGSKTAPAVVSISASNGSFDNQVNVFWVNPAQSLYDSLLLERSVDGGAYTTVSTLPKGTTTYTDTPGYSVAVTYRISAVRTGGGTPQTAVSNSVITRPNVTTFSSLSRTNAGYLYGDFISPGHANIAGFDVALSTNDGTSWGTTIDTGADPDHAFTGIANNSVCRIRSRTRDTFTQVSQWTVSPSVTVVNDISGPVIPSLTVDWNNTLFRLTWGTFVDTAPSMSHTLEVRYSGATWTNVATFNTFTGQTNYGHTIPNSRRGEIVEYRLTAVDAYQNYSVGPPVAAQSKPLGTFYIAANSTWTWKSAGTPGWRSDTDDVISGYFDAANGNQNGYWFYGNQIANVCKGFRPNSASILMIRQGTQGSSGYNFIGVHNHASRPSTPTIGALYDDGPILTGADAMVDHSLPLAFREGMRDGTFRGFVTLDSGSYRRLKGVNSNQYSGLLTLYFD